ncbi:AAA family ATPase [Pseudomonas batumici]|uniref:ParA family protein n=1 Tax=Pseudomonas batumici TaxID=226910 RepID=UPI0030D01547
MKNALLLKRAMKLLNLSGTRLAERVTELREDGKRTAPETISRWLNGTNPVDPFLIGWITEMVRSKLRDQSKPTVRLPKGGLIIAVCNLKGGVGKTTVAMNLAAIAHKSLGLKTTFLFAEYQENKRYSDLVLNNLKALMISCPDLEPREILKYKPDNNEVVIVDVSNRVTRDSLTSWKSPEELLQSNQEGFLHRFHPNIYVVPGNFESCLDNQSLRSFLDSGVLQSPIQLLHRPSLMRMDFASNATSEGFDPASDLFCPFFIPQSPFTTTALPRDFMSDWQDPQQEYYHYRLFEHLLQLVGGDIMDSFYFQQEIDGMNLHELLDLVAA